MVHFPLDRLRKLSVLVEVERDGSANEAILLFVPLRDQLVEGVENSIAVVPVAVNQLTPIIAGLPSVEIRETADEALLELGRVWFLSLSGTAFVAQLIQERVEQLAPWYMRQRAQNIDRVLRDGVRNDDLRLARERVRDSCSSSDVPDHELPATRVHLVG